MRITKLVLIFFSLLISLYTFSQKINNKETGNYRVGFNHKLLLDYSRNLDNSFRPVQLFIWYPSKAKNDKPVYYSDYYKYDKTIVHNKHLKYKAKTADSLIREELKNNKIKDIENALKKYHQLKTEASDGIEMAKGKFPLIILAPGGNTSGHLHSVLAEYLASYGYIVVSTPSFGNKKGKRCPFNPIGLAIQMDDMAFVINYIDNSVKEVNIDKIAMIAWSVGGVSQAIYCLKNSQIKAFVSIDSGIGRTYGINMLKASPYFNYSNFSVPYRHFTGNQPEMYKVERSSEFYDSIPSAEKYSLVIGAFAHHHFASQIGIIPAYFDNKKNEKLLNAYNEMCFLTLTFLNTFIRKDKSAKKNGLILVNIINS